MAPTASAFSTLTTRIDEIAQSDGRPAEYEDVGHPCMWEPFYSDVLQEA